MSKIKKSGNIETYAASKKWNFTLNNPNLEGYIRRLSRLEDDATEVRIVDSYGLEYTVDLVSDAWPQAVSTLM